MDAPASSTASRYAVPLRTAAELRALLAWVPVAQTLGERIEWLEKLARWLRPHGVRAASTLQRQAANARLRALVQLLRDDAAVRRELTGLVAAVLRESSAYELVCETGTGRLGFAAEMLDRVSRHIIPVPPDDADLADTVERLFPREIDVEWLEQAPSEVVAELWSLLDGPEDHLFARIRGDLADALSVVALRAAARGFADDVRARLPPSSARGSAFHALVGAAEKLLQTADGEAGAPAGSGAAEAGREAATRSTAWAELRSSLAACRRSIAHVLQHLEESGVSVDLVYRLELIGRNLDRVDALALLLAPEGRPNPAKTARSAMDLLADLLRQRREARSLRGLVRSSTHLLARKIAERAGHSGEHYIAATRTEHRHLFRSALGGGLVVAPSVATKFLVTWAVLPPFFAMMLYSANYAGAFVLLHLLGFTLATKQPSVTAAALAASIHAAGRKVDLHELAEQVARLSRSQLAAIAGNLLAVVPAALVVDVAARALTGQPFLGREAALYVAHGLQPIGSLALPFAAFTGVLLWTGSVVAAWAENWWVYRRLPEALSHHRRLVRWLGAARAARWSDALTRNVAAVAGNVTLGVLLGIAPAVGGFFGVPLDVRHVTFSTGALALSLAALPRSEWLAAGAPLAILGLVLVALLNLTVSFAMALVVAVRARDVRHAWSATLSAIARRLRTTPREFVWPPREPPPAAAGATLPVAP